MSIENHNMENTIVTTKAKLILAPVVHLVVPFLFFLPMLYFGFTLTAFIVSYLISRWIAGQISQMFLPEFCAAYNFSYNLRQQREKKNG